MRGDDVWCSPCRKSRPSIVLQRTTLLKVPDIMVAEIVDGELHAMPRPAPRHAHAWSILTVLIGEPYDQGHGGPGGWWILGEPELHLGGNVLVPDMAGWRRARLPR